jgi:hypothetical protein
MMTTTMPSRVTMTAMRETANATATEEEDQAWGMVTAPILMAPAQAKGDRGAACLCATRQAAHPPIAMMVAERAGIELETVKAEARRVVVRGLEEKYPGV